ncbi:MAG: ATP phosphoribosyltransferase [Sulfolobaceae archaeon]
MRIAIPNKGRLQQPILDFLSNVGIKPLASDEKALIIPTSWEGIQLVMIRTEDIPSIVESGGAEIGITGKDYVVESGADVEELIKLDFGKAKIVLAVPISWNIDSPFEIKKEIRIATKYYNIARRFVEEIGIRAKIFKVSGATEVMPSLGAADAIIDVMSTGTTLRIHGLKPIATVLESYAVVIGNRKWMMSEEADKINSVLTIMKGTITAKGKKLVLMNVPDEKLEAVLKNLPAMLAPAITKLSKSNVWEVITVVDEDKLPEVIISTKNAGARDIVVVDIEKVIP